MKCGIILSLNESAQIVGAVENLLKCCDEVVVVDSGSSDGTVELALRAGARVEYHAWVDYASQRNYALSVTSADWVVYLDADERLDESAINFVKELRYEKCGYELSRCSYAFGQEFKHGVLRPDKVARIFRRDKVRWIGEVHERALSSLPIKRGVGCIKHYTYGSWADQERKSVQYTSLWARGAYESGRRTSHFGALMHAVGGFFKMYVLSGGFLDGWNGLHLSLCHFHYTHMKYLKLLEYQQSNE